MKPLCIDLFCGLGGWAEGFLSQGWRVIGFDNHRHDYGTGGYPGQLVLQDVLTIPGSQFRNANVIVASPPCTEYSYMAMPWTRAKQIAAALRGQGEFPEGYKGSRTIAQLNALFDACFRIQREACWAAGRYIPLIVENVRGACPWVGGSVFNFGSFHLWGDVPALMPRPLEALKWGDCNGKRFDERPKGNVAAHREGQKVPGFRFDGSGRSFQSASVGVESQKQPVWFNDDKRRATKCGGDWFGSGDDCSLMRQMSSNSSARKAASAQIAKIPYTLSSWIAQCFQPERIMETQG